MNSVLADTHQFVINIFIMLNVLYIAVHFKDYEIYIDRFIYTQQSLDLWPGYAFL